MIRGSKKMVLKSTQMVLCRYELSKLIQLGIVYILFSINLEVEVMSPQL
jgi:hypothetical protein